MRSPRFSSQLDMYKGETNMAPYVSLTAQRRLVIDLPSIDVQRTVGQQIGWLDDKIGLNRSICTTLEQITQAVFRSRFVDFDGAGELVDSGVGWIPRRWRVVDLAEIVDAIKVPSPTGALGDDDPYIGLDVMPRGSTVLMEWGRRADVSGVTSRFRKGDILFGKLRPYFKKVGVAPLDGSCSTEILVLRPKRAELFHIAIGHLSSQPFIDHCDAVSTGTKMPRAEWNAAGRFRIAIPPDESIEDDGFGQTIYAAIGLRIRETRVLAEFRYRLVPTLIPGAGGPLRFDRDEGEAA